MADNACEPCNDMASCTPHALDPAKQTCTPGRLLSLRIPRTYYIGGFWHLKAEGCAVKTNRVGGGENNNTTLILHILSMLGCLQRGKGPYVDMPPEERVETSAWSFEAALHILNLCKWANPGLC